MKFKLLAVIFIMLILLLSACGTIFFFSVTHGIIFAILSTLFLTIVIIIIAHGLSRNKAFEKRIPELENDEHILKQAMANYLMGDIMVGGYLFLTDQKLYFDAHNMLQVPMKVSIPIFRITGVEKGEQLNQINLLIKDGEQESFQMLERESWIIEINRVIQL